MKNIKVKLSDESHKILFDYKLNNKLKTLDDALDKFLKEMKGGKKR